DPSVSLEAAQQGKLDLICRKLRLGPDRRLLDIGCGWGGLLVHASQRHEVKAEGITLSAAQAEMATERIARGELEPSCRVNVRDYRDVDARGQYDALVSVGMFEHVGEAELEGYFEQARGLLKPGGLFLNHGIARNYHHFVGRGRSFAAHHVFPDGELVPLSTSLKVAEKAGFEVRDVESLREHYALTLRHWVRRLEERHEEALQVVDESVYRVWRLYMAGAAHGFRTGRMSVYQVLLSKPGPGGETGLPLTRHHMLCGRDSS
ncbi:MAG: class I SAM-dependent methyltransferase, partial [Terriglobia bacterium]